MKRLLAILALCLAMTALVANAQGWFVALMFFLVFVLPPCLCVAVAMKMGWVS